MLIYQIRTADLIATDIPTILQLAPDTVPNLINVHKCIKALAFSLLDPKKMDEACKAAFTAIDDLLKLKTKSPPMQFICINYGLGHAPHLACVIPKSPTTAPPPQTSVSFSKIDLMQCLSYHSTSSIKQISISYSLP